MLKTDFCLDCEMGDMCGLFQTSIWVMFSYIQQLYQAQAVKRI